MIERNFGNRKRGKFVDEINLVCDQGHTEKRLDSFISEEIKQLSRSKAKQLIENGLVTVNNKTVKPKYKVKEGDEISVKPYYEEETELEPQNIPIEIVYEDKHLLVVNKDRDMVVHPGAGNYKDTLVNALLYHCKNLSEGSNESRPGVVHRLDKDTSGLLVVAKNNETHRHLSEALMNREIKRTYLALIYGKFPNQKATIDLPIGRNPKDRKKMAVIPSGKPAMTKLQLLKTFNKPEKVTYVKLNLETGRTHQIRVHLSHLGHPLIGDPVYGFTKPSKCKSISEIQGQALHSFKLEFKHPIYNRWMSFRAPLPDDMMQIIKMLN